MVASDTEGNGCKLELENAVNHNIPIISVLLQSCDCEN